MLARRGRKLEIGMETTQKTVGLSRTTFANPWLPEKLVTALVGIGSLVRDPGGDDRSPGEPRTRRMLMFAYLL
jgi:hypothetical protein